MAEVLLFSFKFAVEGIIGLSWGFGLPLLDVITGTVVDYMHCMCEGVIDQLISRWLDKSNSKLSFYLGSKVEEISKELTAITPTCEITRTPRSLADVKDWKGNKHFIVKIMHILFLMSKNSCNNNEIIAITRFHIMSGVFIWEKKVI